MIEKRHSAFIENLTYIVIGMAALGGIYVLVDPVFTFTLGGQEIKVGGDGFSEQLKGAVVQTLLIGGWTTALNFWMGASKQGQESAQAVSQIATAAAPQQALAVAAARGPAPTDPVTPTPPVAPAPIQAENVEVQANTATVNAPPKGESP